MGRREGWYEKKAYPHFDRPLPFEAAKKLVTDALAVARHPFLPFIAFTEVKRRFKPKTPTKYKNKVRELKYCSHRDAYIYSYYAAALQSKYELWLNSVSWGNSVIGYRSGLGSNLHMATSAFREIKSRGDCLAIAIDISDFFPSIDHGVLLKSLKQVLGVKHLSDDWYAVYCSMTKYAWMEKDRLVAKIGAKHGRLPRPIAPIETFRQWRKADPSFVCHNDNACGIPQGAPISAVFSNVYMIGFDAEVAGMLAGIGGSYRRYSDDILILCSALHRVDVTSFVDAEIAKLGDKIKISPEKTECSHFSTTSGAQTCDRPLTYLGLTFDGTRTMLRGRTLSRYYRRMTYAARHTARVAREAGSKPFKRALYRSLTHLGKQNFYTYAKRVAEVADDNTPKRQLRRHFRILRRKLEHRGK